MVVELEGDSPRNPESPAWLRSQAATYIAHGFHDLIGLTPEAYAASFPDVVEQPAAYRGRFDLPLVVDPRIALSDYCEAANISLGYDPVRLAKIGNQTEITMPEVPYLLWTHDGSSYEHTPTDEALWGIAKDWSETGVSFLELAALSLHGLIDLSKGKVAAAGSFYFKPDSLVTLSRSPNGNPEIGRWNTNYNNFSGNYIRLLTRGSDVVIASDVI